MSQSAHDDVLPSHPAAAPLDQSNKHQMEAQAPDPVQDRVGDDLSKWLIKMANSVDELDRTRRLDLFRQQIKAHRYLDGNFHGYVDQNLEWRQRDRDPNEVWYSDNQLYPYIRTALMEMGRSAAVVNIAAPEGASTDIEVAAKFAAARYKVNRARTFSTLLKQTENAYALLNGITFRYTFPEFNSPHARPEKMPVMRPNVAASKPARMCAKCQDEVEGDTCPKCGGTTMLEIDLGPGPDTVIGYEEVKTCRNKWIVPNPLGVVVSLTAASVRETPFILWKQPILKSVLEEKYQRKFTSSGIQSMELRYIDGQQRSFPGSGVAADTPTSTGKGEGDLEQVEFRQLWLDYSLYCNIAFKDDMPLGRGRVLKAGQKLGSAFPKGLYMAGDDKIVVDLWDEDKNRKWTSSPYGIRPGSMYGSGVSVALSDQELINDIKALEMANAWNNAVPKEFVDPEYITEISADPAIPTRLSQPMTGANKIVGRAYDVAPPAPLGAEVYALEDQAKSSMQNKIGALSGTGAGGLQDNQKWGDTATAISIKRDMAVGRFAPDLELMADQLDKEQAIQFLKNEQEYFSPGQWEKERGEYGEDGVKAFLAVDIEEDLVISVIPGSFMPKSDAQTQSQLMGYLQVLPLLSQLNNPELVAYAESVFGMPEQLGGWNSDRAYAGRVIKRFQALVELAEKEGGKAPTNDLNDPMVMMAAQAINQWAQMPVDYFLDNHGALIDAYKDWRTTDEGREASNLLLAAVSLRTQMHQDGLGKQGELTTKVAVAAQKPIQDAADEQKAKELAAMAPQMEQQQKDAEEAQQAQALKDALAMDQADQQHQDKLALEREKLAHGTAREMAKAQAATAQGAETATDTPEAVINSVKFSDLPPEGQVQLAAKAGLDIPLPKPEENEPQGQE